MRRLISRAQFDAVMGRAPWARSPHFALHMLVLADAQAPALRAFGGDPLWIGCVLPKRHAKRAVTRNTMRRLIYEGVGRHAAGLTPAAWVARLNRGLDLAEYPSACSQALRRDLRAEIDGLLAGAARRLKTQAAARSAPLAAP